MLLIEIRVSLLKTPAAVKYALDALDELAELRREYPQHAPQIDTEAQRAKDWLGS